MNTDWKQLANNHSGRLLHYFDSVMTHFTVGTPLDEARLLVHGARAGVGKRRPDTVRLFR